MVDDGQRSAGAGQLVKLSLIVVHTRAEDFDPEQPAILVEVGESVGRDFLGSDGLGTRREPDPQGVRVRRVGHSHSLKG